MGVGEVLALFQPGLLAQVLVQPGQLGFQQGVIIHAVILCRRRRGAGLHPLIALGQPQRLLGLAQAPGLGQAQGALFQPPRHRRPLRGRDLGVVGLFTLFPSLKPRT